jgi:hypothetical protein
LAEPRTPLPRQAGAEPLAHVAELGGLAVLAERARERGEVLGRSSQAPKGLRSVRGSWSPIARGRLSGMAARPDGRGSAAGCEHGIRVEIRPVTGASGGGGTVNARQPGARLRASPTRPGPALASEEQGAR